MNTRGFTILEVTIVTAIMALMAASLLPNLNQYQVNTEVRTLAETAVVQTRQLEMATVSHGQAYTMFVSGGRWYAASAQFAAPLFLTTVPPPLELTGCIRTQFSPLGMVDMIGNPCFGNPNETTAFGLLLMCIDNGNPSGPVAVEISTRPATGVVTATPLKTLCPADVAP